MNEDKLLDVIEKRHVGGFNIFENFLIKRKEVMFMSLEDARKFVVDFDTDPKMRVRISEKKKEMEENNVGNFGEMDVLFSIARERGYDFTLKELKEANSSMVGEISDDELSNVAGGLDLNYADLSEPLKKMNDLLNMSIN